ncbi:hypothetical protein IEQ34_025272 [Dendrobium chrysotoxum]|uniref:ResB-like domain-containing protein n=1 Tax=Dendrobium chrysotoxum TaxID=161865 RepID=A0AAV7FR97_DENCH|nr:hypothetical protein IEQ34_025272 [Dendrobium chrysotoxum]
MPFGTRSIHVTPAGSIRSKNKDISRLLDSVKAVQRHSSRCRRSPLGLICQSQQNWEPQSVGSSGPQQLRITSRRILKQLSSLKLAIVELALIAALSAVGTVIKQNEASEYYLQAYPGLEIHRSKTIPRLCAEGAGIFDYRLIWALQWDHIYTANYFIILLALLAASLAACTTTRQWPMVKVARRWRLAGTIERLAGMGSVENSFTLPDARIRDFGGLLRDKGYSIFLKEGSMYAFKGMAEDLHQLESMQACSLSWLYLCNFKFVKTAQSLFLGGGLQILSTVKLNSVSIAGLTGLDSLQCHNEFIWGSIGSVMVPEDGDFIITQALQGRSFLANPSKELKTTQLHVDNFEIEFRDDGSVGQYKSTISLTNTDSGRLLQEKTISVNDPLRYKGMTAYQTDWSIAAISLTVRNLETPNAPIQSLKLPVANLEGQEGITGKLWATFLPSQAQTSDEANPKGISLALRDVQTIAIYDSKGEFVGIRRPESGKPFRQFFNHVDELELIFTDVIGSTGLELKVDPGIPYVYAGFGGRSSINNGHIRKFNFLKGVTMSFSKIYAFLFSNPDQDVPFCSIHEMQKDQKNHTQVSQSELIVGMMITTALSYLSHSQIWALQQGSSLHVSGKTNRAKNEFEQELANLTELVPDHVQE